MGVGLSLLLDSRSCSPPFSVQCLVSSIERHLLAAENFPNILELRSNCVRPSCDEGRERHE